MEISLSSKTALVTGASEGIGFSIALGLMNAGADVVINGRNDQKNAQAVQKLMELSKNGSATAITADLGTVEGCNRMTTELPEVDILINNVGKFAPKDFFELEDTDWEEMFYVNVMSGVRLSQHYSKKMLESGWGRIIFIASESAFNIPTEMIHYGFSKTSNVSIARGLAKHLAGTNITVNSILPGPTLSDGMKRMLKIEASEDAGSIAAEFVQDKRPSSIIQRAATCEEVANMVTYIASEQASATTGASLRVDGGVVEML